jgi:uncharacterized membrane protein
MLHPIIVHLPIGILLFAALCEWVALRPSYVSIKSALGTIWGIGAAAAALACLSGWYLKQQGGYEQGELEQHQWIGIATALVAVGICFIRHRRWAGTLVAAMLMVTGHLGGSMTYGSDYLLSSFSTATAESEQSGLTQDLPPNEPDQPVSEALLKPLEAAGIVVLPVSKGSHFLSLNFVNALHASDTAWQALVPLAPYITWLRCSGATIPPTGWAVLEKLENITRLHLNETNMDQNLVSIAKLQQLRYLNLNHSNISVHGLAALRALPQLEQLYLFKTKVIGDDWKVLKQQFAHTKIDSGGYVLPILETDTARLDAPITY